MELSVVCFETIAPSILILLNKFSITLSIKIDLNSPITAPIILLTNPNPTNPAVFVSIFEISVMPTTTAMNVMINAMICIFCGFHETWFCRNEAVKTENFNAAHIPISNEISEPSSAKKPFQSPRIIPIVKIIPKKISMNSIMCSKIKTFDLKQNCSSIFAPKKFTI